MYKVLIIGYGNCLRSDDGTGVLAAETLAETYRGDPAIRVLAAHQLTPEMAVDIANAEHVLFLDANAEGVPGTIQITPIIGMNDGADLFAHHCTPAALLFAAEWLYGRAPAAMSLTMTAASFEPGLELTVAIRACMPEFLRAAKRSVSLWLLPHGTSLRPYC